MNGLTVLPSTSVANISLSNLSRKPNKDCKCWLVCVVCSLHAFVWRYHNARYHREIYAQSWWTIQMAVKWSFDVIRCCYHEPEPLSKNYESSEGINEQHTHRRYIKRRFSLFREVAAAAAVVLCATGNCNAPQTHSTLNLNKFSNHCLNFLPIQWNAFSIRVFVYRSGIHIYIALAMRVARPSILPSSTRFVPLEILCDRRKLNEQILTLPASLSSSSSRFPFILSSLEQILSLSRIWRGIVSPAL